jgi:hypothetical protein
LDGYRPSADFCASLRPELRCPTVVWAHYWLLRKLGKPTAAATVRKELLDRYPNSIPALFLDPKPGELWYSTGAMYLPHEIFGAP